MRDRTYEDREYWNNVRRDYHRHEKVVTEGNDGESEFVAKVLNVAVGKVLLDVGCGVGEFASKMAGSAHEVVGIDFSEEAIRQAETNLRRFRTKNCTFKQGNADNLPFSDATFDIVVSRRGPVTSNVQCLSEAHRVLKKGGTLMELTIGEKDKANIARIFGRGQMLGVTERVSQSKKRMLEKAGFQDIQIGDYLANEIFESMRDLIIRLEGAPIIPNFDVKRDREYLEQVEELRKTNRGIETEIHRVTIIATKS